MHIHYLCSRDTQVEALKWDGTQESTDIVREWTGYRAREAYGVLLLQSSDLVEQVQPGDYIVKVGIGSFHCWKPEEVAEYYATVIPQAQAV